MMNNSPKIRFKGYTDAWEQRKLGDLFSQTVNLVNPKEDDIELWSLTVENGLTQKTERYTRDFLVKKDDIYKKVNPGDIVYNPMNMTLGAIGYNNMTKSVAISGYYVTMIANTLTDSHYINTWMKSPQALLLYKNHATGSLIEKQRVQFSTFSKIETVLPGIKEQEQIGKLFMNVDRLITLHQRKCEQVKKYKKYMLQKMFPKNGSNVPEIRFQGFTDAWEQRKLGELYHERNERGNDKLPILTVSIHNGVSNGELDEENLGKLVRRSEDKSKYKHTYEGDLVFNMMRAWQGAIGVVKSEGMVSPAYITAIPDREIYPPFMDYCLRREPIISRINNLSYGVTDFRKRLYWEPFTMVECEIPSVEEQQKIQNYFRIIDSLITLHQRKCEELQKIKKFMLQNMFA